MNVINESGQTSQGLTPSDRAILQMLTEHCLACADLLLFRNLRTDVTTYLQQSGGDLDGATDGLVVRLPFACKRSHVPCSLYFHTAPRLSQHDNLMFLLHALVSILQHIHVDEKGKRNMLFAGVSVRKLPNLSV